MNSNIPFLKELAQKCLDKFGRDSDQLTLILPNKRAGLFFRKYLAELTEKPIWSPTILSIEEFILSQSKTKPAEQNYLLFALYSVYKKLIKNAESFDNFYHWGEMILNDFNDIDTYLIDSKHVFKIIKSQKELDEAFYYLPEEDQKTIQSFWASFLPKPTKTQNDFLRTWEILNELYLEFNGLLLNNDVSYKGKIYRDVAENLENGSINIGKKPIWFAGFNAFTKAEERIVKHCLNERRAEIFWDVDEYYVNDQIQESGYFFRQYIKDRLFSTSLKRDLRNAIINNKKKITTNSVALSMGQVKAIGERLLELSKSESFVPEKTVIIIPDENLLLPVLNSIPETIDQVNVTMGYPLKHSNYFTFFEVLLELFAFKLGSNGAQIIKSSSILPLINHACFQNFYKDDAQSFNEFVISKNKSFINLKEIKEKLPDLHEAIIEAEHSEYLLNVILKKVKNVNAESLSILDKGVIFELHKTIFNIQNSIETFGFNLDIKSVVRLYSKLGSTKVPFTGEPLLGLQIMGTLESRNLDFDHVFILDMNEGIWPKDSSNNSFIPYNIRKAFDLPVVEHQDSIQSYLFYRLLHHASTLEVFYNNVSEFNHNGELSRYVQQIQLESGLNIDKIAIANSIRPQPIKPIVISKSEEIINELSRFLVRNENSDRLSPSALNTYLDCKLKFYFKYIKRIKEKEELKEILDAATFGNMLHYTMEYFYKNLIEKNGSHQIEKSHLENSQKLLEKSILKAFLDLNWNFTELDDHNGQQIIASKVIFKFASQIIEHDKNYAPFVISALEGGVEDGYMLDLPIDVNGEEQLVGLKGVIDRIDKKEGVVRILDYKSGGDERNFMSIESLFDRDNKKRNKAVMQVFLYCLFYKQNNFDSEEKLVPGIFNSKDLFSRKFDVKIKEGRSNVIGDFAILEAQYLEELKLLVSDIFEPTVKFDQTSDTKKCEYCPYSSICMRN